MGYQLEEKPFTNREQVKTSRWQCSLSRRFSPRQHSNVTTRPVIIDWIDATQSNPHSDIARTLLLLQQGDPRQQVNIDKEQISSMRSLFINSYLKSYAKTRPISLEKIES